MENVKLKELVDIFLGVTHTPEYVFDGVPFLSVKDISDGEISFDDCKYISQEEYDSLSEGAKPKVGDMLFCRVGTLGKPIIIPEGTPLFGSFVSLGYLRNKDASRCDMNYLRYWMYSNSFWQQVNANVKGASQVNLNTGWLSKFDVVLPEMEQQKYRIATLDQCDMIIRKRKQQIEELDNLIKARFVELFGDQKDNPYEFTVGTLKDVADIYLGLTHTPTYVENGRPFLSVRDISSGVIDFSNCHYITEEEFNSLPKGARPITGDLLFCRVGTIGKPVVVPKGIPEFGSFVSIGFLRKKDNVLNEYLKSWMEDPFFMKQVYDNVAGASQINLNTGWLKNFRILIPPIELQNQFAEFVYQVDKSKVFVQKALNEAQMLFDSLMQQYFG
ncbi:type I restriction enzyme, S subunit [Lachnospiraceae bacterium XBB2008]|nr:type I restriction enzyme, S subunit [Lachnospiraceae bacterium XBB2008]